MAFKTPAGLQYTKSHEWLSIDGDIATIGITDYAQDALGDVVYVEFPAGGDTFNAGDVFGTIESVKAASDLYTPVAGTVIEVNSELEATPELINQDPYGTAWMIRLRISAPASGLLDPDAYATFVKEEAKH